MVVRMTNKPPFDGEQVKLGDVATLVLGQSPSSESYNTTGEGLPFYQGNADFGNEHPSTKVWCTEPKKTAEAGDLLLSVRAPIGAVNTAIETCCIGRGVAAIKPDTKCIDPNYLKAQLLARRPLLESMGTGSTFKAVGKKALSGFPITVCSMEDQGAIAKTLDSISKSMLLCAEADGKFDDLVKSRFVEMFGDQRTNSLDLPVVRLGEAAFVGSSKRVFKNELVESGVPFFRGTEVGALAFGGSIEPELFITKNHYDELVGHTGKPEIGDLLMPSICPDGQIWLVDTEEPFYFKDGRVLWVRPDRSVFNSTYLQHAMRNRFISDFETFASGTTFAELKIFILKKLIVTVPPMEVQQEFEIFVRHVDKLRFEAQKQKDELQTLYDSLAQEYFAI